MSLHRFVYLTLQHSSRLCAVVCCWSFTVIDPGCVHWAVSCPHLRPRTSHKTFLLGPWLTPQQSASAYLQAALRENSAAGWEQHICKCKLAAGRWETSLVVSLLYVFPSQKIFLVCIVVLLKNNSLSIGCIRVVNYTVVYHAAIWNVNNRP